jgi:transcriptional regulator
MYVPRHFAQNDRQRTHELIRDHALATLITEVDSRLEVTHVPVVLDGDRGEHGTLRFHLARANLTARALEGEQEILLVFTGPHTYISPDWYEDTQRVPTWNYAVAHVYGVPRVLDDRELRHLLDDLSHAHESRLPKSPWTLDKLPAELVEKMCRAIVGFELPISEIQGKWKMDQNRADADRAGVVAALDSLDGEERRAVADTMRAL